MTTLNIPHGYSDEYLGLEEPKPVRIDQINWEDFICGEYHEDI